MKKKIRGNQIELSELFSEGVTVTGILDFVSAGSPATSTPQIVLPNYETVDIPATTLKGGLVFDTTVNALTFYNGTSWVQVGGDVVISYGTTGSISLDTSTATYFYPTGTTTGVITFSFTNPTSTGNVTAFTMELLGAGDNAPVWPASVDWPASTEPTWTAGGVDVVSFITRDGGTTWLGMLGGLAFG